MPEVPTVGESGADGFAMSAWTVIAMPAATPADIVLRTNRALNAVVAEPILRQHLLRGGTVPAGGTPADAVAFLRTERQCWRQAVAASGATAD